MKTYFIAFIFSWLTISLLGQTPDCQTISDATHWLCKDRTSKAIKKLTRIHTNYPDFFLEEEIELELGKLYFKKKKYNQSIYYLTQLINRNNYGEGDTLYTLDCQNLHPECAPFLIQSPLLELQHKAWLQMFEIALKTKDISLARNSLEQASRYYRFWYGCGTNDLETDMNLALKYADFYMAINKPDSALFSLLPYALEPAAFPVPYYSDIVNTLKKLFSQLYRPSYVKEILNQSLNDIFLEKIPAAHGDTLNVYYTKISGIPVKVAPEYLFGHENDIKKVKDYMKSTEFYQSLYFSSQQKQ